MSKLFKVAGRKAEMLLIVLTGLTFSYIQEAKAASITVPIPDFSAVCCGQTPSGWTLDTEWTPTAPLASDKFTVQVGFGCPLSSDPNLFRDVVVQYTNSDPTTNQPVSTKTIYASYPYGCRPERASDYAKVGKNPSTITTVSNVICYTSAPSLITTNIIKNVVYKTKGDETLPP